LDARRPRPYAGRVTETQFNAGLTADDAEGHARRNARVLAAAQAVNGSIPAITVTLGGLAGHYLLDADKSLATLPVTAMNLGVALGALPAAFLMRRVGRRLGFMSGTGFAMAGGLLAASAIFSGAFWLFALAAVAIGLAGAFTQQYRFAAADAGAPATRAKAISWVMAGGVLSAVIGPQTVIFTRDLFAPIPFAGAFVALAGLALVGCLILGLLSGPAREPPPVVRVAGGRSLAEIAREPRFMVAVLCAVGSYGLMSLVMTAAPVAMVGCGLSQDVAALGIQWHVLGMFAPSFFTGSLIARFGKERVIAAGMVLLAGCGVVALSGLDVGHFWLALVLLGLGWNFGFIGATALLTEVARPGETARVQGFNDLLVFGSVAIASFSSGRILDAFGWSFVNYVVFPVVVLCLCGLAWLLLGRSRAAAG
jgi:MFS family permease